MLGLFVPKRCILKSIILEKNSLIVKRAILSATALSLVASETALAVTVGEGCQKTSDSPVTAAALVAVVLATGAVYIMMRWLASRGKKTKSSKDISESPPPDFL